MSLINTNFKKSLLFGILPLILIVLNLLDPQTAGKIAIYSLFCAWFFLNLISYLSYQIAQNHKFSPQIKIAKNIFKILFFVLVVSILFFISFEVALRVIFGVHQDSYNVMSAIFGTDLAETSEFIGQYARYLIIFSILFILGCAFYIFVFSKTQPHNKKAIVIVLGLVFVFIHINPTMRKINTFFYFYKSYSEFVSSSNELANLKDEISSNLQSLNSVKFTDEPNTFVLVIGESDTRYNWHLYGYGRDTTPQMDMIKDELLIFKNATAAAPNTIAAFINIMTNANKNNPDAYKTSPDILLLAKLGGYKTYFISNHSTDNRSIINVFASNADELILTNIGHSRGEGSFDDAVIEPYEKALKDNAKKKFIIVHLLGSHPAYHFRYPKEFSKYTYEFSDEVATKLSNEGRAKYAIAFRNLYDNSILYSDFIRTKLLVRLMENKNGRKSWLYFSDHGQDVSHNSNFSGNNYKSKEQWYVPMVFWINDYKRLNFQNELDENLSIKFDTRQIDLANINHTILGLLNISGDYYDEKLDIFK
nr:phosphoethanolamine transferase [Campylobacter sp.]